MIAGHISQGDNPLSFSDWPLYYRGYTLYYQAFDRDLRSYGPPDPPPASGGTLLFNIESVLLTTTPLTILMRQIS